jgi:Cof subfamily protein (haloacid dehalogenase superfamily)
MSDRPGGMFITDLDGTLLRSDRTLSTADIAALEKLGKAGIARVIATGRMPYSFNRLLGNARIPVDYLILSTGAGVIDYSTGEILYSNALDPEETEKIFREMLRLDLDFFVLGEFPENHRSRFRVSGKDNPDFFRRLPIYEEFSSEIVPDDRMTEPASQVVAVTPSDIGIRIFGEVSRTLGQEYSVVRTTSPLDGESMWIEIFPRGVSKGTAAAWLADRLGIGQRDTAAVGNDYNDMDLLDWAHGSYVVENAPAGLSPGSIAVASNDENGVAMAVEHWLETSGGSF